MLSITGSLTVMLNGNSGFLALSKVPRFQGLGSLLAGCIVNFVRRMQALCSLKDGAVEL